MLKAISLVCKVTHANGKSTVKLSDNYQKATGPAAEIERYRKVFGQDNMSSLDVEV
jgi:nicotinate phosphoribosyltransferase